MNRFAASAIFAASLLLVSGVIAQQATSSANEPAENEKASIKLPTGKTLLRPSPSQAVNSFPVALAVSPDGRYVAALNNGYGTAGSDVHQSIAVLDLQSNQVADFPDDRLARNAKQTYFLGLVFGSDGKRLYASMASITDPSGEKKGNTGNGIVVYSFESGKVTREGFFKIPLQELGPGKTAAPINKKLAADKLIPYPAGLALIAGKSAEEDQLLIADNLSDDALLMNASGVITHRFDLSTEKIVPGAYPYEVVASRDGKRGYVSLWNASRVAELDFASGKVVRMISLRMPAKVTMAGSHPTGLLLCGDEKKLYVALANTDEIAVIETSTGKVSEYLSARLPGQRYKGAYPVALALSKDEKRLFVADAGANAVAVFATAASVKGSTAHSALGFIPADWYPQALAIHGDDLLIASGKGKGTGPNGPAVTESVKRHKGESYAYILTRLYGSLARINIADAARKLPTLTNEAIAGNQLTRPPGAIHFQSGGKPIKHVIYIIKENRSYDQVLGDIAGANGDPSLVMYGEDITPNQHKIAREFGVLDNFYASGEVSGDGHNWSTAAIASDYLEKTIQVSYRGLERNYDYEGEVSNRFPLEDEMSDVNEPGTGYLWGNVARNGFTYRHYGEFISTQWCNEKKTETSPLAGTPHAEGKSCPLTSIKKGEALPNIGRSGTNPSPWPWPIPIMARNIATKPELRDHYDPKFPDFNLEYPDQLRADEFLREFGQFAKARTSGKGQQLPNYVLLRLGNDHTNGTKAGLASPAAAVADNDLAVGRVVEAISHSPYWNDTAILILEDDAQNGPDHVDAHRTIAFVISKYSPASAAKPVVDNTFYTTVSMIRTLEALLGLPPMNINDATAPAVAKLFAGNGRHQPFTADDRNLKNGLLYEANKKTAPGAAESELMDFSHADAADSEKLNAILWRDRMGGKPMPSFKNGDEDRPRP